MSSSPTSSAGSSSASSRDSSPATTPSRSYFDLLPVEIVELILEMACETPPLSERKYDQVGHDDPYSPRNWLAPVQISSRLRIIAFGTRALWRSLATIVLDFINHRKHVNSMHLLSLCARQSRNTLDEVNFLAFVDDEDHSCTRRRMVDCLHLIWPSAPCIKVLRLNMEPLDWTSHTVGAADLCERCSGFQFVAGKDYYSRRASYTAFLDLLYDTTSLDQLVLQAHDYWSMSDSLAVGRTGLVQPRTLHLDLNCDEPPTAELLAFFCQLASSTKILSLDVRASSESESDNDDEDEDSDLNVVAQTLLAAASTSLRVLVQSTSIRPFELASGAFQLLKELRIGSDDVERDLETPAANAVVGSLPSLVSVEAPISMLDIIEAPQLRSAMLPFLTEDNSALLIRNLQRWPKLQDLVLHCDGSMRNWPSFDKVLRELTPRATGPCTCPLLQRLSLLNHELEDHLTEEAFDYAPDFLSYSYERDEVMNFEFHELPKIGFALVTFVGSRCRASTESFASLPGGCHPLTTLRLFGFNVRSDRWHAVLEYRSLQDRRCYPVRYPWHTSDYAIGLSPIYWEPIEGDFADSYYDQCFQVCSDESEGESGQDGTDEDEDDDDDEMEEEAQEWVEGSGSPAELVESEASEVQSQSEEDFEDDFQWAEDEAVEADQQHLVQALGFHYDEVEMPSPYWQQWFKDYECLVHEGGETSIAIEEEDEEVPLGYEPSEDFEGSEASAEGGSSEEEDESSLGEDEPDASRKQSGHSEETHESQVDGSVQMMEDDSDEDED